MGPFATRKILLNIEATPSCPAACSMCPRSLVTDDGYMETKTMERIISSVDPSWVWEVDLAGRGEPTIHPRFYELAEVMSRADIPTCVVTTGVTMTEKNLVAMNDHFDVIRISVSSIHQPTFEKVHIGLDYEKIWRNLAALAEVAARKTIVHLTGGPVIYEHLPQTVTHLRDLGFEAFRLLPLWNRGGHFETSEHRTRRAQLMAELQIPPSENEALNGSSRLRFFSGIAAKKLGNSRYCPIGDSSVTIHYDGQVVGCFQDFGRSSVIGHIDDMDLHSFVEGRAKALGNMKVCQGCDAHKVTLFT